MPGAENRLMKDLSQLLKSPLPGIAARPEENNILTWKAVISGPPQSPYENGTFSLSLVFNHRYPFEPPDVRFTEEIFHPNVYQSGNICLDILQTHWSSTYDVSKILQSIQTLLDNPNPNSPANSVAAELLIKNKIEFDKRVKQMIDVKNERHAAATQSTNSGSQSSNDPKKPMSGAQ